MVTNLKPDLVIIDQKKVKVFELTVPAEQRIKIANKLKMEKYSHFTTDIKSHEVTVTPFEVGAHQGHITNENNERLKAIHKYCKKEITFKKFKENISAISLLTSYYIFNCRNQKDWFQPEPILAPF